MPVIALSVSSCTAVSKFKVDGDGMYRFKSQPFVVWAPIKCLLDMAVRDTDLDRAIRMNSRARWMRQTFASDNVFRKTDIQRIVAMQMGKRLRQSSHIGDIATGP